MTENKIKNHCGILILNWVKWVLSKWVWETVTINMAKRTNMKFDINSLIENYFPIGFGGHQNMHTVS